VPGSNLNISSFSKKFNHGPFYNQIFLVTPPYKNLQSKLGQKKGRKVEVV
jgi:uncharacterized protein (DUF1919 family)